MISRAKDREHNSIHFSFSSIEVYRDMLCLLVHTARVSGGIPYTRHSLGLKESLAGSLYRLGLFFHRKRPELTPAAPEIRGPFA